MGSEDVKRAITTIIAIFILTPLMAAAQDAPDPAALITEGKALMQQGDLDGAAEKFIEAVTLAEEQQNVNVALLGAMTLGNLYQQKSNIPEAIKYKEKAAELVAGNAKYSSVLNFQIGDLYYQTGEYAKAIQSYETTLAAMAEMGDVSNSDLVRGSIAICHSLLGEYKAAEEIYTALLDESMARQNATDTIHAYWNLGDLNQTRADYNVALEQYGKGLELAEKNGLENDAVMLLNNVSIVHQARTDLDSAREALDKAMALAEKNNDQAGLAACQHQMGLLLMHSGDAGQAIEHYRKAIELKEAVKDLTVGNTLAEIGRAYYFMGNYKQARRYYNDALKTGMPVSDAIKVRNNLAMVYKMQGMLEYALELFQESLEDARRFGLKSTESALLNNIGIVQRDLGELDQALKNHEDALAINQAIGEKLAVLVDKNNMALVLKEQGDYEGAMALLEPLLPEARALHSYDDLLRTLINLGDVSLLMEKYDDALKYFQEAADTAEQTANPERQWNALFGAGRAVEAAGDAEKAVERYKKAVEVIEGLRVNIGGGDDDKSHFLANKVKVYMRLIQLLHTLEKPDEALKYLERMKARSLLDLIQKGRVDVTKGMSDEQVQKEKQLKIKLSKATKDYAKVLADKGADSPDAADAKKLLDDAKKEIDTFKENLYSGNPELAFARGESEPITPAELQKYIEDDEVLVAYMLADETSYVWTITRDAVNMYDLGEPAEKINFVVDAKLREALEKGMWQKSQERAAKKLYKKILAPIEADLEGKKVMGVLPDGRLYELPFYLLRDGDDQELIDRIAVYYMPSLSVMVETRKLRAKLENQDKVMAFGNPKFEREDLVQLPGTEVEVQKIAEVFGDRANVHFHEDALEDYIKRYAGGFKIIHMATHGLLNNHNPMFSSIAMSGIKDQPDDGFLQAREIPSIELDAELVIMSACESGRGELMPGEGILGLTRSFFSAGVPSIAASMWEVNDQATSFMMRTFYSKYPATRSVDALREAQLATREEFGDNPNLWAPFVIMGFGVPGGAPES